MRSWILALMLLFSAGCFAGDSPGDAPSGLIHQKSIHDGLSYRGRSGIDPYKFAQSSGLEEDEYFIADQGWDLDHYVFRKERMNGTYRFSIMIDRFFGETTGGKIKYPEQVGMSKTVKLKINIYDVDDDSQDSDVMPEIDHIYLNGHALTPIALTSGNDRWNVMTFNVPIEFLNFPEHPQESAQNNVEIQIDKANTDSIWAVEVDWAMLEIKALRPILLLHGYKAGRMVGGNEESYNKISAFFDENRIPYERAVAGWDGNASIEDQAASLAEIVLQSKKKFGVAKLNIIAHSKGGIDTRLYLRDNTSKDVETFIQVASPNHGQNIAGGLVWSAAGRDLDPEEMRDHFNYFKTDVPGTNWLGISHYYQFTPRYDIKNESARGGLFVGIGNSGGDDDGWYAVSHRSATLPWKVECHEKQGAILTHCPDRLIIRKPLFSHRNTWPTRVVVDQMLEGAGHSLNGMDATHYGWMLQKIREYSGYPQVAIKNASAQLASAHTKLSTKEKPVGKNISLDLDAEEVIFRNLPTKFVSAKSYPLMLQKGVSTKISAFLPEAPSARLELESPSGKKINLANQQPADFLVQETINPAESGMWKLNISGPHAEYDSVIVTRPRSHVAIDAGVTKSALAQGEETTIYAYLYDRRRVADTEFENLPKTVNVGSQTMQATLLDGSGKLQTVVLRDDGTGGDAVANDGFFMAHYKPTADGTVFMTVTSVRDSGIQITNDRPVKIDVTAAAGSKIQSLSTFRHAVDRYGAYEKIFFTVNAQLREAGKYYVTAAIKSKAGKHLNSIKSAPVAAIAGGQHAFLLELDRDFILDNKDEMPFSIDTVFLTVATRRKEVLIDHKAFNTVVPYTDPSLFKERKIAFKGVQAVEMVDTDGNGRHDRLNIKYLLNIPLQGQFTLQSTIGEKNGTIVDWSNVDFASSVGDNVVTLSFDLRKLKASGIKNFYLENVALLGPMLGSDPGSHAIAIQLDDVDAFALPDLQIRTEVRGEIQMKMLRTGEIEFFNGGGAPAYHIPWEAHLGINGATIASGVIPALLANQSVREKVGADESVLKNQSLYVYVNPRRTIIEADYSNNLVILRPVLANTPPSATISSVPAMDRYAMVFLGLMVLGIAYVNRKRMP